MRLKHPPGPQRQRRSTQEEELLHSDPIAPPPGSTALHQEGPSGPMVSPLGKREPKVDIQLPQHCRTLPRRPIPLLPHWDHWGNLQGLNHQASDRDREGGGAYGNQHSDLGGLSLLLAVALEQRDPSQVLRPSVIKSNT